MALYAIGDLHLSFSSDKPMDVFGSLWENYVDRMKSNFSKLNIDDTIVLCGDLSWAMSLEEAKEDFRFINDLPGKKIILKGNHDYWWSTLKKMETFLKNNHFDSIQILHNNSFTYEDFSICGTRGWFFELDQDGNHDDLVYKRELGRLETSLKSASSDKIITFLHYPPLYQGYQCPEILKLMESYNVKSCYYGHLHGISTKIAIEGNVRDINYHLVSADYLGFAPKKILD